MFRQAKWWFGFLPGVLLFIGSLVFQILAFFTSALSMGAGLFFLFILTGTLALMTLLVLVLVLLKQTRTIGYGMAVPVLMTDAGWLVVDFLTTRGQSWITPFALVGGGVTLLLVALTFLNIRRHAGNQTPTMG